MSWRKEDRVRVQCYPGARSIVLRIAGIILIAAGAVLVLLCVPVWAWVAAIGASLIVFGLLLVRK